MNYILIKTKDRYTELPAMKHAMWNGREIDRTKLIPYYWSEADGESMFYINSEGVYLERVSVTLIASHSGDIVIARLPVRMVLDGTTLSLELDGSHGQKTVQEFYYNGCLHQLTEEGMLFQIRSGDSILVGNIRLAIFPDRVYLQSGMGSYQTTLLAMQDKKQPFEKFPSYRRSPRIIKRVPDENIKIVSPPAEEKMGKNSLVQLIVPPLIMLSITVAMSILMKRGLFIIMSITGTVMSLIGSVTKYINEKKDCKEKNEKRERLYHEYLLRKRKEINEARLAEVDALLYNYPTIQEVEKIVRDYTPRIFERSRGDSDFLMVQIGTYSDHISVSIDLEDKEFSLETDELLDEARVVKTQYASIDHKPYMIDLKQAHLGIVGDKEHAHELLKLMVAELTCFHSYHDLQFIAIYDKRYEEDFEWMNWYPHFKIEAINAYGSISSERVRDQVMGSICQILKDRQIKQEESKQDPLFVPHFVFIIDDPKLIMDHAIMEYLDKKETNLGISIIYTTQMQANLPEYIGTVLQIDNREQATLILDQKAAVHKQLKLNHIGAVDMEAIARDLSVLVHEQGMVSSIPESITFFELYQIEHPEELKVRSRWQQSNSHKSLAVPLGVRAVDDIVNLNLHEKAHGPHGLVAGTTGSGKSEIVQSYILSLAVNFHPHEVGFLLIDYKGGGMASLFKNLPHLLGTITNLDGSESMRALASIKSELARRQRIFNEYEVNHINGYNQLFKNGTATEPMPHLFLISDEFAELKKEQPDFMKELVSAARIGRSLGVHLILATQKPSGVVDDQIWTNSKFKLALKVQNEADSKEMLKTPDAANIVQPGRAYLQVGNNEIYELFQSAWSGASYSSEQEAEEVDDRVYLINEIGQGELINQDLSGKTESNQIKKTQLDVTIDHVRMVYDSEEQIPVKRPWIPSLLRQIEAPCLIAPARQDGDLDLNLSFGMIDIPEEQSQCEYQLNLQKEGNVLMVASSGFGKSVMLTTALLSLAAKNPVEKVNFYILDFGNSALIPLNQLPHTSEYITADHEELLFKFQELMNKEVTRRKKLFAGAMVQNFEVYNQVSEEKLRAIVIAIDNVDVVKEISMELENFLAIMARDGAGLGIYLLVTANRSAAIKMATMNTFKHKIAGFTFEQGEANGLVGRSPYKVPEIRGRSLVKWNGLVSVMQIYSPVGFEDDVEYTNRLKEKIHSIAGLYPGEKAPRIPVLPEEFDYSMMDLFEKEEADLYLGLHCKQVNLIGVQRTMSPFLILGEAARGKTNLLQIVLRQLLVKKCPVILFDSKDLDLYSYKGKDMITYINTKEQVEPFMREMGELIETRKERLKELLEQSSSLSPKEAHQQLEEQYWLVDDIDDFVELTKDCTMAMCKLIKEASESGIMFMTTASAAKFKGSDEIGKYVKTAADGLVLGNQGTFDTFRLSISERPQFKDGCLFHNGTFERIRIPKDLV